MRDLLTPPALHEPPVTCFRRSIPAHGPNQLERRPTDQSFSQRRDVALVHKQNTRQAIVDFECTVKRHAADVPEGHLNRLNGSATWQIVHVGPERALERGVKMQFGSPKRRLQGWRVQGISAVSRFGAKTLQIIPNFMMLCQRRQVVTSNFDAFLIFLAHCAALWCTPAACLPARNGERCVA